MKIFLRILLFSLALTAAMFFLLRWGMAQQGLELGLHGSIAMALGVFFTMLVGAGLMALLFYSNKSGHDERVSDSTRSGTNENKVSDDTDRR